MWNDMKILVQTLFLTVALAAPSIGLTSGLPPEHEAARLMLSVESLIESAQWQEASDRLAALQSLDVDLEEDFFYYNGIVLSRLGNTPAAVTSLEKYVVEAGKEGQFYGSALAQLTSLEENLAVSESQAEPPVQTQAELKSEDDGYIKSLQALYLTSDPKHALVQQINSLLSSHAYTGTRLKKNNLREGVQYSLSVNGSELLLQERSFQDKQPLLQVKKLNVLGVDPFVEYGCSSTQFLCYLYHPSKANERWILVDRDNIVASELSQALSKLIRLMQQGG